MILFNTAMKNENLAVLALAIIVIGAFSIYLVATYGEDIFNNLSTDEKTIEIGDCADVHYILTLSDGTVFDFSYNDSTTKTGGTPLKVYISMNQTAMPPMGYSTYSSGLIEGFMEGLVGLREGETAVIGPIPPEKGYGANKIGVGDMFTSLLVMYSDQGYAFNQTFEVVELTDDNMTIQWVDVDDLDTFTLPEGILMEDLQNAYFTIYDNLPPFFLWENATETIGFTDGYVEVKLTPTSSENITDEITFLTVDDMVGIVFPDATIAEWDNDTVTITSSPTVGTNYSFDYFGTELVVTIDNISADNINLTLEAQGQQQSLPINRTISFNRIYLLRRYFVIPTDYQMIFAEDFEREGYSLNELAGEVLTYEVTIEEIYKTSQDN